jgi:hypothetical protein
MTTVLLVALVGWMVSVECRLWVNIHRLNEHLEAPHQARDAVVGSKEKRGESPFGTRPVNTDFTPPASACARPSKSFR